MSHAHSVLSAFLSARKTTIGLLPSSVGFRVLKGLLVVFELIGQVVVELGWVGHPSAEC